MHDHGEAVGGLEQHGEDLGHAEGAESAHCADSYGSDPLTPPQVNELNEDVEYYIDNNQDPDFQENEYIYDVLPVDLIDFVNAEDEELAMLGRKGSEDGDDDEPEPEKEKVCLLIVVCALANQLWPRTLKCRRFTCLARARTQVSVLSVVCALASQLWQRPLKWRQFKLRCYMCSHHAASEMAGVHLSHARSRARIHTTTACCEGGAQGGGEGSACGQGHASNSSSNGGQGYGDHTCRACHPGSPRCCPGNSPGTRTGTGTGHVIRSHSSSSSGETPRSVAWRVALTCVGRANVPCSIAVYVMGRSVSFTLAGCTVQTTPARAINASLSSPLTPYSQVAGHVRAAIAGIAADDYSAAGRDASHADPTCTGCDRACCPTCPCPYSGSGSGRGAVHGCCCGCISPGSGPHSGSGGIAAHTAGRHTRLHAGHASHSHSNTLPGHFGPGRGRAISLSRHDWAGVSGHPAPAILLLCCPLPGSGGGPAPERNAGCPRTQLRDNPPARRLGEVCVRDRHTLCGAYLEAVREARHPLRTSPSPAGACMAEMCVAWRGYLPPPPLTSRSVLSLSFVPQAQGVLCAQPGAHAALLPASAGRALRQPRGIREARPGHALLHLLLPARDLPAVCPC